MSARWLKFAASASCLCAALWWTDAAQVLTKLRGLDLTWIALALCAVTLATLSMAHRWQAAARAFGVEISFAAALREYYLGQLINTVLPGGVAGDMARAVRARHAADLPRAAQSVMAERLLGQMAMLTLMFAGFAVAILVPGGVRWHGVDWVVVMALVACAVLFWRVAVQGNSAGRFARRTSQLFRSPTMLMHGVITTLCLIFAFYACARAVGTAIPPAGWATLIPLTLCAMLIPLSIGGWGWREGAAGALFPIVGEPASAGIATGIAHGVVLMVAVLPAVFIVLTQGLSETRSAKEDPNTP